MALNTRTVQIRRVHKAPDLNGDLSQPAWKDAPWNRGFVMADQTAFGNYLAGGELIKWRP